MLPVETSMLKQLPLTFVTSGLCDIVSFGSLVTAPMLLTKWKTQEQVFTEKEGLSLTEVFSLLQALDHLACSSHRTLPSQVVSRKLGRIWRIR